MTDPIEVGADLSADEDFQSRWQEYAPQWSDDTEQPRRKKRLLKLHIIREAVKAVDDGERDEEAIVDRVCGSLTFLIVSVLLQELVRLIVRRILERWT